MAHDNKAAVNAGRVVAFLVLAALAGYLWRVGLEKAQALATIGGVFIAAAALLGPYLVPSGSSSRAHGENSEPDGYGNLDLRYGKAIQINHSGPNHQQNTFNR
jgi:hypothetical protein